MTRAEKLAAHLEHIVMPLDVPLTARQIAALVAAATPEQKAAAFARALVRSPLLLDEEREGGFDAA